MIRSNRFLPLLALLLTIAGTSCSNKASEYYERGYNRQSNGDFDGAILDFNKAIELKPDFVDAYHDRGVAHQAKSDLAGAIADYTKAIELKPDFALAYSDRGFAKEAKGDSDGSLASASKRSEQISR